MTKFLIRKFIRSPEQIDNPRVRQSYGTLSSLVGIACNLLLFLVKYIMGTLANSISIVSDAFNNLSDGGSCLITLFGYKMAAKPADKNHPFGHGRMEYLTSLLISVIILVMGLELLKGSVLKILHPEAVEFRWMVLVSLLVSIGVKLWMAAFNAFLGKKINSTVMEATAKDSRNDVIATAATVVSLLAALFTDLPVDGAMGVLVSVFIFRAGFEIIRDTVDELLGKPADPQLVQQIAQTVQGNEQIIGIHDLMIHSYGPGCHIGSCHAEVRSSDDFVQIHDVIDSVEREITEKLGVLMTIHLDPVDMDDAHVLACRTLVSGIVQAIDSDLHIHDFRVVSGESHTNLIFDVVVPFRVKYSNEQLKEKIDEALAQEAVRYYTVITFDQEFAQLT